MSTYAAILVLLGIFFFYMISQWRKQRASKHLLLSDDSFGPWQLKRKKEDMRCIISRERVTDLVDTSLPDLKENTCSFLPIEYDAGSEFAIHGLYYV